MDQDPRQRPALATALVGSLRRLARNPPVVLFRTRLFCSHFIQAVMPHPLAGRKDPSTFLHRPLKRCTKGEEGTGIQHPSSEIETLSFGHEAQGIKAGR